MGDIPLKTRFAPSPTGYLHLGHVAHILYVLGLAVAKQAEVVFRIEDHDQGRCRPEYLAAMLADLQWFQVASLPVAFPLQKPSIQSARFAEYEKLAHSLFDQGLVYGCSCSRREVQARLSAPLKG